VRTTVFQAAVLGDAASGETHFASATAGFARLSKKQRLLAASLKLRYAYNRLSQDAFLPPLDIAGKKDGWLRPDGTAKLEDADTAHGAHNLLEGCLALRTCGSHSSPLVVPHPRTGKPAFHLDVKQQMGFDSHFNFSESQAFLRQVLKATTDAAYRHRWRVGDIVISDNYAVLHTAAPGDGFNNSPRLIERICLPGGTTPMPLSPQQIRRLG
jgi:alpha-ketoglutarate-dependent taurine dioxygenase